MVLFFLAALKTCSVPTWNRALLLSRFLCAACDDDISHQIINNSVIFGLWSPVEEEPHNYINNCDGYFHQRKLED